MTDLISEAKQTIETKQLLFQYDKELHLLIGLVERLETAERQREEAVKALEWYGDKKVYEQQKELYDENEPLDFYYEEPEVFTDGGDYARKTLKRIKGATQAEGHQND